MLAVLAQPLDRLDAAWSRLAGRVESLAAAQLAFAPDGGWSIHQVVHHLELVEGAFAHDIMASGERGPRRRRSLRRLVGMAALRGVMATGIRVRMPAGAAERVRPRADAEPAEIFRRAADTRTRLRGYLESIGPGELSRGVCKHPVAGPLDFREALWFVEAHFRHHLRQIARIERRPDFPAG